MLCNLLFDRKGVRVNKGMIGGDEASTTNWLYAVWLAFLTLFLSILGYIKKRDDQKLDQYVESHSKEHKELWDKKADAAVMAIIMAEMKESREERRAEIKELRDILRSIESRSHHVRKEDR